MSSITMIMTEISTDTQPQSSYEINTKMTYTSQ